MAVIDATFLCDELHWLAARIALYEGVADRLVVVEGTHTFQGQPRRLLLAERTLPGWVEPYVVDLSAIAGGDDPWAAERATRDAVGAHAAPAPDDIVISCDVDEFWDPGRLGAITSAARTGVAALEMDVRVFDPGWRSPPVGSNPKALIGSQLECCPLSEARRGFGFVGVARAGWHLTSMGGQQAWDRKIASFAHSELNNPAGRAMWFDCVRAMRGPNDEELVDVGTDGIPPVLLAAAAAPFR